MKGKENHTSLRTGQEVRKDDRRIVFRGKMDSLYGMIALAGAVGLQEGKERVAKDLEELGRHCLTILYAEVREQGMEQTEVLGMSWEEIRTCSHHPEQFGLSHFFPVAADGTLLCLINLARTCTREAECIAVSLEEQLHPDIVTALNRLSSAVYVVMCRLKSGYYQ